MTIPIMGTRGVLYNVRNFSVYDGLDIASSVLFVFILSALLGTAIRHLRSHIWIQFKSEPKKYLRETYRYLQTEVYQSMTGPNGQKGIHLVEAWVKTLFEYFVDGVQRDISTLLGTDIMNTEDTDQQQSVSDHDEHGGDQDDDNEHGRCHDDQEWSKTFIDDESVSPGPSAFSRSADSSGPFGAFDSVQSEFNWIESDFTDMTRNVVPRPRAHNGNGSSTESASEINGGDHEAPSTITDETTTDCTQCHGQCTDSGSCDSGMEIVRRLRQLVPDANIKVIEINQ